MDLKNFLKEESGTNVSIQFFDEYDKNNNKVIKKASYSQNGKTKTFELDDISDNVPDGVIRSMKKAILKNTGVSLDNIDNFKKYAGQNFKYKDGAYDISFTITEKKKKRRGTSNIDKSEIKKAQEGRRSEAENQKEREDKKVDIKKMSNDIKDEIKNKKHHNVTSREVEVSKRKKS